ncbi:LytR/AlgR family response regulator transcription factor [Anditalea andensis]|uniref:LytR family transcriptional regulator n=1 Tax=Anditalea andensis TaxID=1048983 RepID=A0A074KZN5_9BACT|nr:LytTR family transcriptional regulator DNA-binding domain-containing protein [Anditalea andensis]KEO74394.1 LytR family transcriptional regulator [Anditalea andensis]
MIKAVLIDDEPLAIAILQEYLSGYPDIEIVAISHDGFSGFKAIQEYKPELIFLDVQMPKISGFEMLELLENPPGVIFTTAFDEYAIQAFDKHAVDYLLKPFSPERFDKALQKFRLQLPEERKHAYQNLSTTGAKSVHRVVVKTGNSIRIISLQDIVYIEASDDYVIFYTASEKFIKTQTLKSLERGLDEKLFVRIHRSYIVQLQQIAKIERYEKDGHVVILKNGKRLPVSKTGYPKLKASLSF